MRKFKLFLILSLMFVVGVSLTACGSSDPVETNTQNPEPTTTAEKDPNSIPRFSGLAISEKSPLKDPATLRALWNKSQLLDEKEENDGEKEEKPVEENNDNTGDNSEGEEPKENPSIGEENENVPTNQENEDSQDEPKEDDKQAIELPKDDMPETPENAEIEDNLLPEISVKQGGNVTPFYAEINQDVYVSVSISNPNSFAILRFKLNGTFYQSFQFEEGSTSELIVVKVQSGDVPGIKEYTIDEIKYVSDVDNQIRDAIIDGEQTVKLSVAYDKNVSASVANEALDLNSYEATIFVSDPNNLVNYEKQDATLYFTDGEKILLEQALQKGTNTFRVNNLEMGKNYQYMVVANYDRLDKDGYSTHLLLKKDVNTSLFVKFSSINANYDSIDFDYKIINKDVIVGDIYLLLDGEAIAKTDKDHLKFDNLLSNTEYELRIYYNITILGEELTYRDTLKVKTLAHKVPTVNATIKVYESSVEFNVFKDDEENLLDLQTIKLYDNKGEFVAVVSYEEKLIENLNRNANYTLRFIYSYDLNDGNGTQEGEKVVPFSTSKAAPKVEIKPFSITENSIQFDLIITDPNVVGRLNSLRLFKVEGKTFVTQLNDSVGRIFTGLNPNTKYAIEIGYEYDLDDGNGSQLATFELEVSTSKQTPTFTANVTATEDGYEIVPIAKDPDQAGKVKKAEVLLDGEIVKEVNGGELMTIDGLLSNKEYLVKVVYEYDLSDLNGVQEIIVDKPIKTLEKNKPVVRVVGLDVTYSSFAVGLTKVDPSNILTIDKLEVKLGTTLVKTIEDLENDLIVDGLYSNNKYEIVVYHKYDMNDGEGVKEYVVSQFVSTLKRDDILYSYSTNKMLAGTDFIEFDISVVDKENLSSITAIELFDANGELVQSLEDLTVRRFENLELESFYSIVTTYKYDMNDGKGEQEDKVVIKYGTSGSKLFVTGLQVLNNENPSVGEEVQVRISLDNPNNLKVTGIFISNQFCPVLNNIAQKENVIIKFIPETEGGYYTVEVTGYEYESAGVKLQDSLTTEYYEDIIVMGELEIVDYFAISDTNYETYSSSPMRILEINNPTGYEIKSITYRSDFYEQATNPTTTITNFELIDNNHILIKERGVENNNYQYDRDFYDLVLVSLTYGIGDVERTLNLPSKHSRLSLYDSTVHIKTVDELLEISSGTNVSSEWSNNSPSYYKYYILDNDLDLKNERWSGIIAGGVFDGNGHTIKNLTTVINDESTDSQYYGLFKEFRGIIFNLNLENIYISIKTKGTVSVAGISASKGRVYDSTVSGLIEVSAPKGVVTGVSNILGNLNSWNSIGFAISTNNFVNNLVISLTQVEGTTDNTGGISNLNGALVTDQNSFYFRPDGVLSQANTITYGVAELASLAFGNSYLSINGNISYPIYIGDTSNAGALYITDELVDHEYHIHTNCEISDIIESGIAVTKLDVKREGYIVSWYDNEEFSGDAITFPYKSDDKFDLYAKWERYTIANTNYTYEYRVISYSSNEIIKGYIVTSFNVPFGTDVELVIGGYYNGLPVFGVEYEAIRNLITNADGNLDYDECRKHITVYYTNTVNFKAYGNSIPSKATYFQGKLVNPIQDVLWGDSGPNIYVPKEYEEYYNNIWFKYDSFNRVKTFTAENNPFDVVCTYAQTNDDNALIKAKFSKVENLMESIKFDAEDLPYQIEMDFENNVKYIAYGDSRFAIINKNVYAGIENIASDELFKYLIYNDGTVTIVELLNPNLISIDLTNLNYKVTEIANSVFSRSQIKTIVLNNELKKIGSYAFYNTQLTDITFPISLEYVGEYAFANNYQLKSVVMNDKLDVIRNNTFYNCENLTDLVLSSNLKEIGNEAFYNANRLFNVNLPNRLIKIGNLAFYRQTHYGNVVTYFIPSSVKTINRSFNDDNDVVIYTNLSSKPIGWQLTFNDDASINVYFNVKELKTNDKFNYIITNDDEVIILKGLSNELSSFEFEEGPLVEISKFAFQNYSIPYVVLPDSVRIIGKYAFSDFTTIYSKSNISKQGYDSSVSSRMIFGIVGIVDGEDFKYVLDINNQASIIGLTKDYEKSVVDFNIEGVVVTSVGNNIFRNNRYINKVIIPEGVTTIGDYAFYQCYNIHELSLPSTLKIIGTYAFANALGSLSSRSLEMPASVEKIGNYAFADNYGLNNIKLNEGLKYVGAGAFSSINVKLLVIPRSVETAEESAFRTSIDGKLLVQAERKPQGWNEYFYCYSWDTSNSPKVIYEDGKNYVLLNIDENYDSITKTLYENEITTYPVINVYNNSVIEGWYLDKDFSQEVEFPFVATSHITNIYAKLKKYVNVWYYNDNSQWGLRSGYAPLTINEAPDMTMNDAYAQWYLDSDWNTPVDFPFTTNNDVSFYVKWVRMESYTLNGLDYYINQKGEKIVTGYSGTNEIVDLSVIDGLNKIGNNAFYGNSVIKEVIIPITVNEIGANAFESSSIERIEIPSSVVKIGYAAFRNSQLKQVVLNDGLKDVDSDAFANIKARLLEIPASVETVGSWAFNLNRYGYVVVNREENFDKWVDNFTDYNNVIYNYNDLKAILLIVEAEYSNNGLTLYLDSINSAPLFNLYNNSTISGWYLDEGYNNEVTFPFAASQNITLLYAKVEKTAIVWYKNGNSETELVRGTVPFNIDEPVLSFEGNYVEGWYKSLNYKDKISFPYVINDNITIYPKLVKVVEEEDEINNFYYYTVNDNIVITSYYGFEEDLDWSSMTNLVGIGPQAFSGNTTIKTIKLPNTVTSIGAQAFSNCNNLTGIELNDNLKSIGDRAFYRCYNLTNVELPNSLTHIGNNAFYECRNIRSIEIPSGVTRIEYNTFQYCYGLKEVVLSNNLTYIGSFAFYNSGIKTIKLPEGLTYIADWAFGYCNSLNVLEIPSTVNYIGYCGVKIWQYGVVISNNTDNNPSNWGENYYGQNDSDHPTLIYNNIYKWIVLMYDNSNSTIAYRNNITKSQLENVRANNDYGQPFEWYLDPDFTMEVEFNEKDIFSATEHIVYLYGKPIAAINVYLKDFNSDNSWQLVFNQFGKVSISYEQLLNYGYDYKFYLDSECTEEITETDFPIEFEGTSEDTEFNIYRKSIL